MLLLPPPLLLLPKGVIHFLLLPQDAGSSRGIQLAADWHRVRTGSDMTGAISNSSYSSWSMLLTVAAMKKRLQTVQQQSCRHVIVRRKLAVNVVVAISLCCCYFLLMVTSGRLTQHSTDNQNLMSMAGDEGEEETKPKVILYWTGYYDRPDMTLGFGREPFVKAGCKVTNCLATADRSLLNDSDALIFSVANYNTSDLPAFRSPHQRYIFYLFETLPGSRNQAYFTGPAADNYFNWTMTHRRDSDIYTADPYGAVVRKKTSPFVDQLPPNLKDGQRPLPPSQLMASKSDHPVIAKKTQLIAWFCSNQRTHGKREEYVKELQNHMTVHVYGKCGNMTCQPRMSAHCNNLLDTYKFYLSAENSICPDYVSEKFYRALEQNVVPVVYGGADYTQYAPPHSFISVGDFASPKQLADYLLMLDRNPSLYLKYFEWKKDWQVLKRPMNGWCDMCEKLNDPNEPVKVYADMAKWWYDDVPCYPGSTFVQSFNQVL